MALTDSLIAVSDIFGAARSLSRARVATMVMNDGKALDRIAQGGDVQTRSYERAMAWFDENWPEGAAWPEGVERPSLSRVARAVERAGASEPAGVAP